MPDFVIRPSHIGAGAVPGADRVPMAFVRSPSANPRLMTISVESGINRASFTVDGDTDTSGCADLIRRVGFRVFREGWFDVFGGPS